MKHKILIIEDEIKIARFLELELKHEGYETETAYNGVDGLEKAQNNNPTLILLDIMLPGLSGIEVCRRIRLNNRVPIIMLTAKDDISDKVTGLDAGADDYVTKPFAIEEVLARVRVAIKRLEQPKQEKSNLLVYKGITFNRSTYEVFYNEELVPLTKKEYELLEYLIENKGIVLTREKIMEAVWGYDFLGDTNIIDVYIRYLRKKIDDPYKIEFIQTIRGVGYKV